MQNPTATDSKITVTIVACTGLAAVSEFMAGREFSDPADLDKAIRLIVAAADGHQEKVTLSVKTDHLDRGTLVTIAVDRGFNSAPGHFLAVAHDATDEKRHAFYAKLAEVLIAWNLGPAAYAQYQEVSI